MPTQKRIREAQQKWSHSANALEAWYRLIRRTSPSDFAAVKQLFPNVDKHVFDIGGNP